jgi:hypothetical protein
MAAIQYILRETGAFITPAHISLADAVHAAVITSHMKQVSLKVQFGIHCMRKSYISFMYNL